ncbi:MAG: formylglycine-generating enzyme family protein [Planctomycetota bacterium]|nr:formylglycine-generating enzyme family protein [Planctomycetota bacterium]MEC9349596.1 formylglycine-generating enzyme family protein [Planctomycetota bacterium]
MIPAFTATGRNAKTVPYATVFRVLFAMILGLSGCRQPRESSVLPEPRAEIIVRPARVFHRGEIQLEAELALPRRAAYSWTASEGKLLSNDSSLVFWEAPASGKSCLVTVTVQLEGSTAAPISTTRKISLNSPSTGGMALIPAGEFEMGDNLTDLDRPDFIRTSQNMADKPAHKVRLPAYWMDRQRVTNLQYVNFLQAAWEEGLLTVTPAAVMGNQRGGGLVPFLRFSYEDLAGLNFTEPRLARVISWKDKRFLVKKVHERLPAVDVTWAGAQAYALFHGKALPTEAQWEYAARGSDSRRYPWGNELPTPRHANLNHLWGNKLFPVGTFSPLGDSPFGIQEMIGGVFEWVNDWYNPHYYADNYSADVISHPRGPHWGRDRSIRGIPSSYFITGADFEAIPTTFRYSWFLELPIGDGFANAKTGFRTVLNHAPRPVRRRGR